MLSIYDALYNCAQDRQDLTRWLRDEDIVQDYLQCARLSARQREQLQTCLGKDGLDLFSKFCENWETMRDYEQEMLFCQGLAMGLELGLCARL